MKETDTKLLCFVESFSPDKVKCYFFNLGETRVIERTPFFERMKLFKGKNIVFNIKIETGTITKTCVESKSSKALQLWNYYFRKKFTSI